MNAPLAVYKILYDLVDLIANTHNALSIPIFKAHQNIPSPKGAYIAISLPSILSAGMSAKSLVDSSDLVTRRFDYTGSFQLYEVNSELDVTRIISQELDYQYVKDFLYINKLSIFKVDAITSLPRESGTNWVSETITNFTFAIGITGTEQMTWIETVETINMIGA